MVNARKLTILTDLRRTSGVTLEQMARACGLVGTKSRESVVAWERGQSVPRARFRPNFIDYLGETLGLRHDPDTFHNVWDVVVEEWGWEPLGDAEWREHFHDIGPCTAPVTIPLPLSTTYTVPLAVLGGGR